MKEILKRIECEDIEIIIFEEKIIFEQSIRVI